MLSKCPGIQTTVEDGGAHNCQGVQGASNDTEAITDIISEVSLRNSF